MEESDLEKYAKAIRLLDEVGDLLLETHMDEPATFRNALTLVTRRVNQEIKYISEDLTGVE